MMRSIRVAAVAFLVTVGGLALGAGVLAPYGYAEQDRERPNARPSLGHPLGTDSLGRDRSSRLLYGSRVSLGLAPLAALAAIGLGAVAGLAAGYLGGWLDSMLRAAIDLFLSLPWLFAVLTARTLLPLNAAPWVSAAVTFFMLAFLGWAPGARVVRASVANLKMSPAILHARACGCGTWSLLRTHILPNLRPVLSAQFWILVPVFLLTEANLGVLGLGIAEPLPSLGNMLAELQDYDSIPGSPWMLAPAALVVLVVASLHFLVSGSETWE